MKTKTSVLFFTFYKLSCLYYLFFPFYWILFPAGGFKLWTLFILVILYWLERNQSHFFVINNSGLVALSVESRFPNLPYRSVYRLLLCVFFHVGLVFATSFFLIRGMILIVSGFFFMLTGISDYFIHDLLIVSFLIHREKNPSNILVCNSSALWEQVCTSNEFWIEINFTLSFVWGTSCVMLLTNLARKQDKDILINCIIDVLM